MKHRCIIKVTSESFDLGLSIDIVSVAGRSVRKGPVILEIGFEDQIGVDGLLPLDPALILDLWNLSRSHEHQSISFFDRVSVVLRHSGRFVAHLRLAGE